MKIFYLILFCLFSIVFSQDTLFTVSGSINIGKYVDNIDEKIIFKNQKSKFSQKIPHKVVKKVVLQNGEVIFDLKRDNKQLASTVMAKYECEITGVKGFTFGMSRDQVLSNEQFTFPSVDEFIAKYSDINSESDIIDFDQKNKTCFRCRHETTFINYPASGSLYFSDKGLYGIAYDITLDTRNNNKFVDTYFHIKSVLTKKYGKPVSNESLQYPYEDEFPSGDQAGFAISIGKGGYFSTFKCEIKKTDAYINLRLTGDNYKVKLSLSYWDLSFDVSEEVREKELLDQF